MFFNMLVNVADDSIKCSTEVKSAIRVPTDQSAAANQIKNFVAYVNRIGEELLESGGTKARRPSSGSAPFFLSYFWQIQERTIWPVFYTNSVNVMTDMNLWIPTTDLASDYLTYKKIHEELSMIFTNESGKHFGLYEVEHVFWFKGGNPFGGDKPYVAVPPPQTNAVPTVRLADAPKPILSLPESYVPPILAVLPQISRNEPALRDAAKASGTSLERAFEKAINASFTMLGFETKLMGQGQGRVPDGQALNADDSYVILWDAKVRSDQYNMGTDDRAVREYITTQSRDLKKRRGLRNIYYLIISSEFADDYEDAIRSLKMETDVNEVCLVEADALVAIVEARLRAPREVSLGPDGIQRLFSSSGIVSTKTVSEILG